MNTKSGDQSATVSSAVLSIVERSMACRSSLSSGRFERATEADAITRSNMGRRYTSVRLFVNFFQPSFKLASKTRDGAKVTKHYYPPATPYQRLLADPRVSEAVRACVNALQATLDPVRLLSEIRLAQKQLVEIADRPATSETAIGEFADTGAVPRRSPDVMAGG